MTTPVNFELAKLLKEKSFNIPTRNYYEHALTSKKDKETNDYKGAFGWKKGETNLHSGYFINRGKDSDFSNKNWFMCSAPTISEVVMWLYEKHGIWVNVNVTRYGKFWCNIIVKESCKDLKNPFTWEFTNQLNDFNSPTEAYQSAIEYVLKNLIK